MAGQHPLLLVWAQQLRWIGRLRVTWYDKPFWLSSPSGKEKVLVWMPWHGDSTPSATHRMVADYQQALDNAKFPYDISYMRWSGHGDNGEPESDLCEFVKAWNEDFEWPKFIISSTSEAFSAFEKQYGSEIPQFKGDLTPYWEDGAGSSALETGINRSSADRLTQAEALAAMLAPSTYRAADFNDAWRNILLYSEHTWGASASVRDSESPMTTGQWAFKRQFALDGETQSESLLAATLSSPAESSDRAVVDVYNATSWSRTEVVLLSKELSTAGDHVRDGQGNSLPSQRLSTGELALLAHEVPSFGSARFHLSAERSHAPVVRVSLKDGVLDNSGTPRLHRSDDRKFGRACRAWKISEPDRYEQRRSRQRVPLCSGKISTRLEGTRSRRRSTAPTSAASKRVVRLGSA